MKTFKSCMMAALMAIALALASCGNNSTDQSSYTRKEAIGIARRIQAPFGSPTDMLIIMEDTLSSGADGDDNPSMIRMKYSFMKGHTLLTKPRPRPGRSPSL